MFYLTTVGNPRRPRTCRSPIFSSSGAAGAAECPAPERERTGSAQSLSTLGRLEHTGEFQQASAPPAGAARNPSRIVEPFDRLTPGATRSHFGEPRPRCLPPKSPGVDRVRLRRDPFHRRRPGPVGRGTVHPRTGGAREAGSPAGHPRRAQPRPRHLATVPLFDRRATVEEATAERPARVIARVPATLAPPVRLAATGTGSRPAVVAAGILLAVGGLAVAVGSGPRPAPRAGARGSRALSAAPGAPVRDQLSLR